MNITPEMMYWLTRLDNICCVSFIFSVLFGIGSICMTINVFIEMNTVDRFQKVICTLSLIMFFVFIAASVFVPSTKEMAAIYVVPKIANSETVRDLGEGVVTLAREWIEELRPAKEGGAK